MGGGNDNPPPAPKPKPAPPPPTEIVSSAVAEPARQRAAMVKGRGTYVTEGQKLGSSGEILGADGKQLANVANRLANEKTPDIMSIESYIQSGQFKTAFENKYSNDNYAQLVSSQILSGTLERKGSRAGDLQRSLYVDYVNATRKQRQVQQQQNQEIGGTTGMSI